jgi:hypothetical protein
MSLLSEPVDVELLAPIVLVFFLTANAEVVILPAVKSAIAVTIEIIANDDVLFVCIISICTNVCYYIRKTGSVETINTMMRLVNLCIL